jgi:hypothetical protein
MDSTSFGSRFLRPEVLVGVMPIAAKKGRSSVLPGGTE